MKARISSDTNSRIFTHMNWFMTMIGIVTAIVCFLVVMNDQPNEKEYSHDVSLNSPAAAIVDKVASAPNFNSLIAVF